MSDLDKAKELLSHYITLVMQKQGLNVDGDTYTELGECVDRIVAASVKEAINQIESRNHVSDR